MFIGLAITFGVGYYVSLNENMLFKVFSRYMIYFKHIFTYFKEFFIKSMLF